jgi:hypothetical protein
MNAAQRLLLLCGAMGSIFLFLIVPFRGRVRGEPDWIVYAALWDPPFALKPSPGNIAPRCPDGGPFFPLMIAETVVFTLACLGIYRRLGRDDETLESYPGYRRGF